MLKLVLPAVAAVLMGLAASQAQAPAKKSHGHQKPPEPEKAAEAPPPPIAEWFGNAVDDILTGAGKALTPPATELDRPR